MRDTWFCINCFRASELEHDGARGICLGCRTPVIRRRCSEDVFHSAWYPVAKAVIAERCLICGAALDALQAIDESNAPQSEKDFANLLAVIVIGAVGGLVLSEIFRDG